MLLEVRLVNMSTRARRYTTQAHVLACLQVVFHSASCQRTDPSPPLRKGSFYIIPLGRQSALRPLRFASTIVRRGYNLAAENKNASRQNTHGESALGTLGSWGKATHTRLSLRGKARLLPRAASTIRVTMLRRRNTASLPRSRLVSHHANRRLAVPLRSFLSCVALTRPFAKARFSS